MRVYSRCNERIENPRVTGSIPVQATKTRRKRKTPQTAKFAGFFHGWSSCLSTTRRSIRQITSPYHPCRHHPCHRLSSLSALQRSCTRWSTSKRLKTLRFQGSTCHFGWIQNTHVDHVAVGAVGSVVTVVTFVSQHSHHHRRFFACVVDDFAQRGFDNTQGGFDNTQDQLDTSFLVSVVALIAPAACLARSNATPPPATMPSSTAARVACRASSTRASPPKNTSFAAILGN